jgi:ubiquinone/menaquinone biosynthesis C-methylase UbiE
MPADKRLEQQNRQIDKALRDANALMSKKVKSVHFNEFDVRGRLYDLAHKVAPNARRDEINTIKAWLKPKLGERSMDVAAGSGFLTRFISEWTSVPAIAVDPSHKQLMALRRNAPNSSILQGYPDDRNTFSRFSHGSIDFATSLGGIHHVVNQRAMLRNVARLMRGGGRFVFADVCADTTLARHFDEIVARKCLTGHTARWLSEQRVLELIEGLPLTVTRMKIEPIFMKFTSEMEMYLFFKGLHAFDLPMEEVLGDLNGVLGRSDRDGEVWLNWPLLFVNLSKKK